MGATCSTDASDLKHDCITVDTWPLFEDCMADDTSDSDNEEIIIPSIRPELAKRTVIVFDWDDTLLCSYAVKNSMAGRGQLRYLEQKISEVIAVAKALGEVLIVTNGNRTWVHDSASYFLPGLLPLLKNVTVVSARGLYEEQHPDDPFMWKQLAFEELFTRERHFAAEPGLNLIALGDQYPELDAAQHVVGLVGGSSTVKTVKFKEQPTVLELIGELSRMTRNLAKIVEGGESNYFSMVPCGEDSVGVFAARASSWSCVPMKEMEECAEDCALVCAEQPKRTTSSFGELA